VRLRPSRVIVYVKIHFDLIMRIFITAERLLLVSGYCYGVV